MKQVILIHGLPDDNEFDDPLIPSPSNSQWFPGVVKSIIFDPRDPFQAVLARAPVNIQELRFVQVVK
jgi:hypothetical protein